MTIFMVSFFYPHTTRAQQAVDVVGPSRLELIVTAAATSLSKAALSSLALKEWTADGVGWALAKLALSAGIRSTTQWVRTGFKGSPMYVTDPGAFFLNVADETAGEVLYGSDLAFLCSPINVRIALNLYYQSMRNRNPLRCTLTGAAANVEQFMQGNFLAGGWPAWLSISLNPSNTMLGSVLSAQATLEGQLGQRLQEKRNLLDINLNFLNVEKCTPLPPLPDGSQPAPHCETQTAGRQISEALDFKVTASDRALIEADEIQELIGALAEQALFQGLSGLRGMFGSSQNSRYGGTGGAFGAPTTCKDLSPFEKVDSPLCDQGPQNNFSFNGVGSVFEAVQDESVYQAMHRRIISSANSVIDEAESHRRSCGTTNDGIIIEAQKLLATASSTIRDSQSLSLQLTFLQTRIESGTPEERLEALSQFTQIFGSNILHDSVANARQLPIVDQIIADLQTLRESISDCSTRNNSTGTQGGG